MISTKPADKYNAEDFSVYANVERHEMLEYLPKEAALFLDVGCAVGCFGQLIKSQRSSEVWGIEVNEYAASIASQKLDRAICGAFDETLDLPKGKFDCIIFNDVLEHLVDPYSALLYSKTLLRDGGKIVASIPNVRYFDNIWKLLIDRDWKYSDFGVLDRTHLRFFTKKSIIEMFEELGMEVEIIQGINSLEKKHPYRVRKFNFLNKILMNQIDDMRYIQFAVVARPISH